MRLGPLVHRGEPAALVEDPAAGRHALLEGPHQFGAVVGGAVLAVEAELAVVGPVLVAEHDSCCVELGDAVVALVAGEVAQRTAGDVFASRQACRRVKISRQLKLKYLGF